MSQSTNPSSGQERSVEPAMSLSRADLAMLLSAERRLAGALARPAEVLRFFLLAVEETAALLKVDRALLCLVDAEDPHLLRVMAGTGMLADEEGELLPVDGSFEGRVYQTAAPVRTNDLAREGELYWPRRNPRRGGPAVAVPLRVRNRPIGVLLAAREPGGAPFLERDAELLLEFATPITATIEAMRQFDATRRSREAVESWTREQGLRRWIARYEAVAAARLELVFRIDRSGSMEWGSATESLFGIAPSDFAPHMEDFLGRVHPDDVERVKVALRSVVEPGQAPLSVEFGLLLRSGATEQRVLRIWNAGQNGERIGVLEAAGRREVAATAGTDASGQEPAPPDSTAEAVVRSLRHQINNPLAAVIGRTQLLIREEQVQRDPLLRQSVETILFEAQRINRFVQQLQNVEAVSKLAEPLPGDPLGSSW